MFWFFPSFDKDKQVGKNESLCAERVKNEQKACWQMLPVVEGSPAQMGLSILVLLL